MAYQRKPNYNNFSTMAPGTGVYRTTDSLNSKDYQAINNGRIFVKNMPPEMMKKIQNGQIKHLGSDFDCYVRMSPGKKRNNEPSPVRYKNSRYFNGPNTTEFQQIEESVKNFSPYTNYQNASPHAPPQLAKMHH